MESVQSLPDKGSVATSVAAAAPSADTAPNPTPAVGKANPEIGASTVAPKKRKNKKKTGKGRFYIY